MCLARGGSPNSPLPYGFPYLAAVLGRLLKKLGLNGKVDVLGVSWGGALAQQFAFQNPRRCRRLILVSTGTGAVMVPGNPLVLAKMLTPRRFLDHNYAATIAGDLYGGTVRNDPSLIKQLFDRQLMAGSRVGYLHQLLAGAVWTSLFALTAGPPTDVDHCWTRRSCRTSGQRQDHGAVAAPRDGVHACRRPRRPDHQRRRIGAGDREFQRSTGLRERR